MSDLGTLGGTDSYAYSINDKGQIVGSSLAADNTQRAFITGKDGLIDLNTLINPLSGWTLLEANAINNNGQIVGYGIFNGQGRGFILSTVSAVPEPETYLMLMLGLGVVGYAARRKRQEIKA